MSSFSSPLQSKLHEIILGDRMYVDKVDLFVNFIDYLNKAPRYSNCANINLVVRPRGFALTLANQAIKALIERDEIVTNAMFGNHDLKNIPTCPVVHLALSKIYAKNATDFSNALLALMQYQMWEHHIESPINAYQNPKSCFLNLIKSIAQKRGESVVVLVDNYDVPFYLAANLDAQYREDAITVYLDTLNAIKQAGDNVRFCLLSGHVKFPLATERCEGLPLINDLSYNPICDTLFGFTMEEMVATFDDLVRRFAPRQGITAQEFYTAMQAIYGGYTFSDRKKAVLCPGSINQLFLNEGLMYPFMARGDFTYLKQILSTKPDLEWILGKDGQDPLFQNDVSLQAEGKEIAALLYQLGFLSIKKITRADNEYNISWRYKLDISNIEALRTLKYLLGISSKQLIEQNINPLVLQDGEDDFYLESADLNYKELLHEHSLF